jgi:uncharacterized protein YecE (DUF72 family)
MSAENFYSGTSGLVLPFPKKNFPPQFQDSSRLAYYATIENSIEINSSFYRLPLAATVKKWANEVPGKFRFTFKFWKEVTHQKNLEFKEADIKNFMAVISQAENKAGCLLLQFPPGLQIVALPRMEELLGMIDQYNSNRIWNIAVEFRHRSWYQDSVYELLINKKMNLVTHDMPASAAPLHAISDSFIYLRFHGPDGSYKGSYSDSFLSEYAHYIREWLAERKKVYVYFNNTAGDALNNLDTLKRYVNDPLK